MLSAFGIEHGELVAKLGPPQYRGQVVSVHERNKKTGDVTTHHPTQMNVLDTKKKTLILRRPKYRFTAVPQSELSHDSDYVGQASGSVKMDRRSRKQIHAHVTGKSGKRLKEIGGYKVRRVEGS